jgi:hypothetical protein
MFKSPFVVQNVWSSLLGLIKVVPVEKQQCINTPFVTFLSGVTELPVKFIESSAVVSKYKQKRV